MQNRVKDMEAYSLYVGELPDGCIHCRRGAKLVLFVTGLCANKCFYCPISSEKSQKDVIYANERYIFGSREEIDKQVIQEGELIDAEGTGITGGDPLSVVDRTAHLISALKKHFGKEHHIHLYTATPSLERINRLVKAGLDEIRFHPPAHMWKYIENTAYKKAVEFCRNAGLKTGFEIPAIPGREEEIMHLIRFAESAETDFVNLNELEFSDTNRPEMEKRGFVQKNEIDYGVLGSEEIARKILKNHTGKLPLHYCSASFKNGVQLQRRIARRANNVARKYDYVTEDGTLIRGLVTGGKPEEIAEYLQKEFCIPEDMIGIENSRVYTAPWILEELFEDYFENFPDGAPYEFYIVEEYPTADRLEVERIPLLP